MVVPALRYVFGIFSYAQRVVGLVPVRGLEPRCLPVGRLNLDTWVCQSIPGKKCESWNGYECEVGDEFVQAHEIFPPVLILRSTSLSIRR